MAALGSSSPVRGDEVASSDPGHALWRCPQPDDIVASREHRRSDRAARPPIGKAKSSAISSTCLNRPEGYSPCLALMYPVWHDGAPPCWAIAQARHPLWPVLTRAAVGKPVVTSTHGVGHVDTLFDRVNRDITWKRSLALHRVRPHSSNSPVVGECCRKSSIGGHHIHERLYLGHRGAPQVGDRGFAPHPPTDHRRSRPCTSGGPGRLQRSPIRTLPRREPAKVFISCPIRRPMLALRPRSRCPGCAPAQASTKPRGPRGSNRAMSQVGSMLMP